MFKGIFGRVWAYSARFRYIRKATSLPGFPPEVHGGDEGCQVHFSPRCCCRPGCRPPPRCRGIGSTPPPGQHCSIMPPLVGEKLQIFKGKPLQRREAWAGNHCQSWVEVHCRRRTSSPDSSPSWRTGGRWQPGFGTTVPTRWRWMVPAPVPPTRTAPWHRGTWKSSYHGCGWLGPETGRRQPRSRERRWTTRRGCRARQSCCGRRWCGGRSQWLARSPDPDFETCSDSCSASLPHCCTGLHWRVGGCDEPRQRLVVLSFSALCLDPCRSPPHPPTVDQQGGSGCAQRGAGAAGGDHPDPSLKASLAAEVAGAEAPVQFFRNFSGARECQTDLVILVVLARTLGVDERQSLLLGLQSTVITTVINCNQLCNQL